MPTELGSNFRAFTTDEWVIAQQLLQQQALGAKLDDFVRDEYVLYQGGKGKEICKKTSIGIFYVCGFCEMLGLANQQSPGVKQAETVIN